MQIPPLFRPVVLLTALLATLAGATAHAGNAGDLGIQLRTVVQGADQPAIIVNNTRDVKKLEIVVTDPSGKRQVLKAGGLGAGSKKTLSFRHPGGTLAYKSVMDVTWGDGEQDKFTLDFEATRVGKLVMDIKSEDVDLDARKLKVRVTNPAASIELTILGESGQEIAVSRELFDPPAAPGTNLELAWEEPSEKILTMTLKVYDIAGFWVGMKITPFSIEIPHDELVFDSGASAVRADQSPKLEATWGHVQEALLKHGTLLQLKLFIAGYTDTVGDKASNRALSHARAASIAAWFRKRGLKIPIYYAGFGEDVLAVQTPDETEEQKNRRAIYILSSHTPSGPEVPRNEWRPL
jgi:outer membrane protein OmpA-like peptidoglycan-associated protein